MWRIRVEGMTDAVVVEVSARRAVQGAAGIFVLLSHGRTVLHRTSAHRTGAADRTHKLCSLRLIRRGDDLKACRPKQPRETTARIC